MKKLMLSTLVFGLVVTAACQKTRDAEFASGQGDNLYSVAEYKDLKFEIETGAALPPVETTVLENSVETETKLELADPGFSNVAFRVSSPAVEKLIAGVHIKARPNFKYEGQAILEEKSMTLFMLAKETDVPVDVADYSIKIEDGRLRIPLKQFAIEKWLNVTLKKNDMGETTSTKIEKDEKTMATASFFKMDAEKGKAFIAASKDQLIRCSYFAGEWFMTEKTYVPDAESKEGIRETLIAQNLLLKIAIGGDSLRVVDATVDLRNGTKSEWQLATNMIIDIERLAFKRTDDFLEMADKELKLRERPFVKVDFASARTRTSPEAAKLVFLQVQPDSFSFTLEDKSNITRARTEYTFVRKTVK